MQLKNHEWTLMNTNLRTRTMIQPFAPQSLNDGREFRRKGTPILWFHWCLLVFIGGLTASFRLRHGKRNRHLVCCSRFSVSVRAQIPTRAFRKSKIPLDKAWAFAQDRENQPARGDLATQKLYQRSMRTPVNPIPKTPFRTLLRTLAVCLLVCACAFNARATIFSYRVSLDGPSESPANASPGFGLGEVDYNSTLHTLFVGFYFSNLLGTTTASHIHAATANPFTGTAGVATTTPTFAGFPLGVNGGVYTNTLDLTLASSWNTAFVSANGGTFASAEAALAAAMASGEAYLNVHSSFAPGGEIRGFLVAVPEPSALAVFGLGASALAWKRRARHSGPSKALTAD
jgi:hypothetical protein